MSRSKVDPVHMMQFAFDDASESFKTKLTDTEIAMELSAEDGDSVISKREFLVVSLDENSAPLNVSMYSQVCCYGDATTMIIQLEDNSILAEIVLVPNTVTQILAPYIKVNKPCKLVLRG
jgi:hypothetical protein